MTDKDKSNMNIPAGDKRDNKSGNNKNNTTDHTMDIGVDTTDKKNDRK